MGVRLQRPGRRAQRVAVRGAYGGGVLGALGATGWFVVRLEAFFARRVIGIPADVAPDPTGVYGSYPGSPVRMVVLGDSSATGLGCETPDQTPGALLAGGVAAEQRRSVRLDVVAFVGARSADLQAQVERALEEPVDLAVIMIGANDVTHRVRPGTAGRDLGQAVRALRANGAKVVVGTCPDLGTVEPLLEPLRSLAAYWSRRMAATQTVAVAESDGVSVSLGSLLGPEFSLQKHLWSEDRFHPSPHGYRRVADVLLPVLLADEAVLVAQGTVQDVAVAAGVAAREPGVTVEMVPGEAIAAGGAGRLARLVRHLPRVGRREPDTRVAEDAEPETLGGVP